MKGICVCSASPGAPGPPGEPFISRYGSAITIHWSSGDPGKGPITRYVIEARPSGTAHALHLPHVRGCDHSPARPQRHGEITPVCKMGSCLVGGLCSVH